MAFVSVVVFIYTSSFFYRNYLLFIESKTHKIMFCVNSRSHHQHPKSLCPVRALTNASPGGLTCMTYSAGGPRNRLGHWGPRCHSSHALDLICLSRNRFICYLESIRLSRNAERMRQTSKPTFRLVLLVWVLA